MRVPLSKSSPSEWKCPGRQAIRSTVAADSREMWGPQLENIVANGSKKVDWLGRVFFLGA